MESDHESTQAEYGSGSEDESMITIKCHTLDGNDIGDCIVSKDATVGQLISKLKLALPERDLLWFQNRKFTIGNQDYGFDDEYLRFMLTSPVKQALESSKPQPVLDCCIIQCSKQLAGSESNKHCSS